MDKRRLLWAAQTPGRALARWLLLATTVIGFGAQASPPQPAQRCSLDTAVVDGAGAPRAGIVLAARDGHGWRATGRSDGAGRWQVAGASCAALTVTARPEGAAAVSVQVAAAAPGSTRSVRVVVPTRTVADKRKVEKRLVVLGAASAAPAKVGHGRGASGMYGIGAGGGGMAMRGSAMSYGGVVRPQPMSQAGGTWQPAPKDREGYDHSEEMPFASPQQRRMTTFSIDVDRASYANVRRFVEREKRLPPQDAVRVEELVNAFSYSWPGPSDDSPLAVHTELTTAPWQQGHRLLAVALQGRRIDATQLPPANLVFLIDVSGSMGSPDKLPLVQQALALLVHQLRPQDKVAIVVYAGAAGVVLAPTGGDDQQAILAALASLHAGGSTDGAQGIERAYELARASYVRGGNNRVILCTDGDFNVGVSDDGALVRLIEREREAGIGLSVLGFGSGNYQDAKMQKLAQHGNGNHAYIDSVYEARKVLVEEMGGTLLTIAKDVKIQFEPNPRLVKAYRLIGYETRKLESRDFRDDRKDAGEVGAGHTVTALFELIPADGGDAAGAAGDSRYTTAVPTRAAAAAEVGVVRLRYKLPHADAATERAHVVADAGGDLAKASDDVRFAIAVAELALLLRGSALAPAASFTALIARAEGALGADVGGHRRAFVALARRAAHLRQAAAR